jgi:hypothetical protein
MNPSTWDQVWNRSRSSGGTPSSSAMTSGQRVGEPRHELDVPEPAVHGGAGGKPSISWSLSCWIRGASCAVRRPVNWPATKRRSRVCSGGSAPSMLPSSSARSPM